MERLNTPSSANSSKKSFISEHSLATSNVSISRPSSQHGSKGLHSSSRPLGSAGASGGRITPAISPVPPDYLRPVVKSAVRRWHKLHEQHMMEKLMSNKEEKREANRVVREKMSRLARRIPVEVLAREWLNLERASIEVRAFLIDQLLPTVILGLEQLLEETERRGLTEKGYDPNFNPINYLGQYLMRNNPRYSNFSEASPYIRGLREVSEELRLEIFQFKDNKLAKLKAQAKKKREMREAEEKNRYLEHAKKQKNIQILFELFLSSEKMRVDQLTIQSSVKSFTEIAERFPEELRTHLRVIFDVKVVDTPDQQLSRKEFAEYMQSIVQDMPFDIFEQFVKHMEHCAINYKRTIEKDQRHQALSNLFIFCDQAQIGSLDRARVLTLFEKFYELCSESFREQIRDPRKWPVLEVHEELEKDAKLEVASEQMARDASLVEDERVNNDDSDNDEEKMEEDSIDEIIPLSTDKPDDNKMEVNSDDWLEEENIPLSADKPDDNKMEVNSDDWLEEEEKSVKESLAEETVATTSDGAVREENSFDLFGSEEVVQNDDENVVQLTTAIEVEEKEETIEEAESIEHKENVHALDHDSEEESVKSTGKGARIREVTFEDEVKEMTQSEANRSATSDDKSNVEIVDEASTVEVKTVIPTDEPRTISDAEIGVEPLERQATLNVSFSEDIQFDAEKTDVSFVSLTNASKRSQSSAFDEENVNLEQFVHLTETFLGDEPSKEVVQKIVQYIHDGYVETDEERMARLLASNRKAKSAKRKVLIDQLFELWDNDGSGHLDLDDVETVVLKFYDGVFRKAAAKAKKELRQKQRHHDKRLTKRQFRAFLYSVVLFGNRDEDSFEELINFLISSVERSYVEKLRGDARRKWLSHIRLAAATSAASMEPIYRAVFQALFKDAEAHGDGKCISSTVAMLESNVDAPEKGSMFLRFVASTPDDAAYVVGRCIFKGDQGICFKAVESGNPVHVPRVAGHKSVFRFLPNSEKDGAFVAVPLKDRKNRVFGTLGVDTLNDPKQNGVFMSHEIQFYQGVAKAFSISYHQVDVQRKTLRVADSALSWICRRSPSIQNATYYLKEMDHRNDDYVLRKMLYCDDNGSVTTFVSPPRIGRLDNLFRDYLFKSVDTSESVSAGAYGERHLAVPLRDINGLAVASVDISIGNLKELPEVESKEVMQMLDLMQLAYSEIVKAAHGEDSDIDGDAQSNAELLFDKLMLMNLKKNLAKLDAQSYAELRSYKEPPPAVHLILQAVLALVYPDMARQGVFKNWSQCKKHVKVSLAKRLLEYDPQSNIDVAPLDVILKCLSDIDSGKTQQHGSKPAMHLYNWVFVCVSLIEHTIKMRRNKKQSVLDSVPEEAPAITSNIKQTVIKEDDEEDLDEVAEPHLNSDALMEANLD